MSQSSGCYSQIKMWFSPGRFKKFVNDLEEDQKGFVQESGFGQLILLSDFKVSVPLLEWVLSKIIVGVSEFRFQGKSIRFTPSMVGTVLGIPSGNEPIQFSDEVDDEVVAVYDDYLNGKDKPAISRAIQICLAEHNKDAFMRSFMLVALATVICPGSQNSVDLKYLQFLMRSEEIMNYDWTSHVLQCSLSEVRKFQSVINSRDVSIRNRSFFYCHCLPMFAVSVISMIFLFSFLFRLY